jgi:hypothetical protein
MAPAIFAGQTKCNDLITIADFHSEADRGSILLVTGGLNANPVELRRFGGQNPLNTRNRPACCRSCAPLCKGSCAIQARKALESGMTEQLMSAPVIGKASKGSTREARGPDAPLSVVGNSRA